MTVHLHLMIPMVVARPTDIFHLVSSVALPTASWLRPHCSYLLAWLEMSCCLAKKDSLGVAPYAVRKCLLLIVSSKLPQVAWAVSAVVVLWMAAVLDC